VVEVGPWCSDQLINLPVEGVFGTFPGDEAAQMAEIINLRVARKRAERQRSKERAATARVSHGMSKAERMLAKANRDKIRREVDEHRIETGEVDEIVGR
jgi:hypothetical protein